ncbi:MAG: hypothetical protein AAFQ08_02415 [Bacteroidota bacterium]
MYNGLKKLPQFIANNPLSQLSQWGKTGIEAGSDVIKAFLQEARHEWENQEEYEARRAKVRNLMAAQNAYERVFNAEAYHLNEARSAGHILGDMTQAVIGEAALKWTVKAMNRGVRVLGRTVEGLNDARRSAPTTTFVAPLVSGAGGVVKLTPSQQKAIRSLQNQITKHRKKLADFKSNPSALDNKGFLKNVSPELREKIIKSRIEALEHQIGTFKKDIEAIKNGTKQILEKGN